MREASSFLIWLVHCGLSDHFKSFFFSEVRKKTSLPLIKLDKKSNLPSYKSWFLQFLSFRRTSHSAIWSFVDLLEKSIFQLGQQKSSKKNPLPLFLLHLFIREGEVFYLISCLMIVSSVIITFLLWRLPSVIFCVVISFRCVVLLLTLS